MNERLWLTLLITVAGVLLYQAWLLVQRRRLSGLTASGRPTLLYFSSPNCAPCRFQQSPAVEALRHELGAAVDISEVDVVQEPQEAARWRVMTVPTTIVLSSSGRVQAINPGLTPAHKLRQQLLSGRQK